ncbi:MAG: hypothetical protein Q8R74_07785 [Methylophilus sp.]|nr:hypothetical protein [Methylophilus sp.]
MKIIQTLLLLTSFLPYASNAADGPLPVINFELIADSSKVFSDEYGRFTDFISAPTVSGDSIYFVAKREQGNVGIYSNTRGVTKKLVDTQTEIPDGVGQFAHFETAPMGTAQLMVFRGVGSQEQQGIYLWDEGKLKKIVDTNTLMPNTQQTFKFFKRPVFDGNSIVFVGRGYTTSTKQNGHLQGAYRYDLQAQRLEVIADWTTQVPGRTVQFGAMDDITVSGRRTLLTASDTKSSTGIFVHTENQLARLVDESTSLPNLPQQNFGGLNDGAVDRSFETENFAFKTASKDGQKNGLHAMIAGKLYTMADTRADMAGGSSKFSSFSKPNIFRDRVTFIGKNPAGQSSIYHWKNGKRHPIIHGGIKLSGKTLKDFNMSLESMSEQLVVFTVTFEDDTKAIYAAHMQPNAGRVVINDNLHGKSKGKIEGGQFVAGGGWTVTKDNDRIVWAIPPMSSHGLLEVDIRNFDPKKQLTADKNIFLGLWGSLFQNHEHMNMPYTDNWELRIGKAHPQFKIEYHARGFGKATEWQPFDSFDSFDPNHTYRFRLEWNNGKVSTWIDDKVLHFDGLEHEDVDKFNYLHIGTSSHFGGTGTIGPIYSNVRIVSFD